MVGGAGARRLAVDPRRRRAGEPALLDALGDLVSDRRIHQYSLPIHWPWPDSTRRLVGGPLRGLGPPLRLVRNDGRLAFYAAKHAIAVADNPIRHMDELPVYHLDLLFADRTSREAKVARYDAELFGLMTAEGLPVNAAYYVPESAEEPPATIHIPREDSDRIEQAIRALGSVPAVEPEPSRCTTESRSNGMRPGLSTSRRIIARRLSLRARFRCSSPSALTTLFGCM